MAREKRDVELLHASMQRMGTMSMAEAYRILGYNPHHYWANPSKDTAWDVFERAVDGKWPGVVGAKPGRKLYDRADWDDARGDYDFFTDIYAHQTPDLIRAYPEAKVVVVQRDFKAWYDSYKSFCLDMLVAPAWFPIRWAFRQAGSAVFDANEREKLGFFGVKSISDITPELAREKYDEFFAEVRTLVPPERRLEYNLGDGWEPLCKFLDKPVPDVPFPRVNERKAMAKRQETGLWSMYVGMSTVLIGIGAAGWYAIAYALYKFLNPLLLLPLSSILNTLGHTVHAILNTSANVAERIAGGTASVARGSSHGVSDSASSSAGDVADSAAESTNGVAEGAGDELASVSSLVTCGVVVASHFDCW